MNLRTDIYGFFPGFGPFEAIRHKMSPGFDFSYAPEVSPTELQTTGIRCRGGARPSGPSGSA